MKQFGEIFRYQTTSKFDKTRFFNIVFEGQNFFQAKMFSNGTINLYTEGSDILPAKTLIVTYKEDFQRYE